MRAPLRRLLIGLIVIAAMCGVISGDHTYGTVVAQTLADDGTTPMLLTDTGIRIDAELYSEVSAGDSPPFMIYLRETADLSAAYEMDWIERGEYVYEQLQAKAVTDQSALIKYLIQTDTKHTSFWINNSIYVEGMTANDFNGLLRHAEIESIEPQHIATIPEVEEEAIEADSISTSSTATVQPNLDEVNAPEVWAQGIDGSGIVVANIDTGVRYTHQTLVDNYRGNEGNGTFDHNYNWYDATDVSASAPIDDNGHGTHTMGIMVGNSDSDIIGMATGAEWISCKGCVDRECSEEDLLECAEFILAPTNTNGLNADPAQRPNIVNNSWGDGNGTVRTYDDWFQNAIDSWQAAGIYPVFSAGNGPTGTTQSCGTVGNPARYSNVTAVGATSQSGGAYASYSVRGPSDRADTINPSGYPYLKPQVVAPGTDIVSAYRGSDTELRSLLGTSMAAPHVAGLIALMWQAAPCLIGDYATTENLLEQTANAITTGLPGTCTTDPSGLYPNNSTGWGEIDAEAAVEAARNYCGDSLLQGRVTNSTTGSAISQAIIRASNSSRTISTRTNSSGSYTLAIWPDTYTLTLSAYGYETASYPLTIGAGASETLDFQLAPLQNYVLSGTVIDAETNWPLYARISYEFTDQEGTVESGILWSDPVKGTFAIDIPEGAECEFQIEAYVEGYRTYSTSFTAPSANSSATYGLYPCAECTAPGAKLSGETQTFNTTYLPFGWTTTGTGATWRFDDPGERGNETGGTGGFAIIDSDYVGPTTNDINAYLSHTYDIDVASKVTLSFKQSFRHLQTEIADVDVSVNGGSTWTNVYRLQGEDVLGPDAQEIDISNLAAGKSQVIVRFHYYGANNDWYWQIDDVHVFAGDSACDRINGGLVVGQVYAIDTDTPLASAEVSNSSGYLTITAATADVNVDDGFYTLFTPTGSTTIQATSPYYDTASSSLYMSAGTTRQVDFVLGAPRAAITATSYTAVLTASEQVSYPLRIANQGSTELEYEIIEQDLGSNSISSAGIETERLTEPLSEDVLAAIESLGLEETQTLESTTIDASGTWQVMASLPEGRTRPAVAAVGQKVYVIGGSNAAGEKTNTMYCYDIASNTWTELGAAPITLDGADAAVIAGHIYIPGDADSGTTCVYDTFQNVWTIIEASNDYSARWEYATATKGSDVYVLGGLKGSSLTNEVWILDTTTKTWSLGSSMFAIRLGFAAGWVDDTLVAAGGVTGIPSNLVPLLTTELWNGSSWSYGASIPSSSTLNRWSYMADGVGVDGLWLAGGPRTSALGESNDTALYSAETNSWTVTPTLSELNQARGYLEGAIAADGYFYAIGGQSADGQTVYSTVERLYVGALDNDSNWLSTNSTSGVVAPGEEAVVTLTLNASATSGIGSYHAAIAINTNDPLATQVWVPITLTVSSTTGSLSFSNSSTSNATGYIREAAVHNITLTNTGQSSDYYTVSVSGNTWTTTAQSLVGPLAPGESTSIAVSVDIPSTAEWRDTDTCTLSIQSALTTQTKNSALTTTALPPRMHFPLIYN